VVQTEDLPEAVPPATPIMKGVVRGVLESFLLLWQVWQLCSFVISELDLPGIELINSSPPDKLG
jgi:hypothetical protein